MERIPVVIILVICSFVSLALSSGRLTHSAIAQDLENQSGQPVVSADSMSYKLKTLGGKQFWTDQINYGGWRIQINAISEHYRLLDPTNRRHHSGTKDECLAALDQLKEDGKAKQCTGQVVIVLHGLIRTTHSMRKLGRYLQDNSEITAVDFEYASTRKPVAYHAQALADVIDSLGDEVNKIHFVAHSMGNIVVRHYLADLKRAGKSEERFGRMVMIGPPNQGSKMARVMRWSFLFNVVAGAAGYELGKGWDELEPNLATPDFEFGIIAGGQSDDSVFSNFILVGKDDFTVSVEEASLPGATDFLIKPLTHATMMRKPLTLEATLRFLNHGYFIAADQKNPIIQSSEP